MAAIAASFSHCKSFAAPGAAPVWLQRHVWAWRTRGQVQDGLKLDSVRTVFGQSCPNACNCVWLHHHGWVLGMDDCLSANINISIVQFCSQDLFCTTSQPCFPDRLRLTDHAHSCGFCQCETKERACRIFPWLWEQSSRLAYREAWRWMHDTNQSAKILETFHRLRAQGILPASQVDSQVSQNFQVHGFPPLPRQIAKKKNTSGEVCACSKVPAQCVTPYLWLWMQLFNATVSPSGSWTVGQKYQIQIFRILKRGLVQDGGEETPHESWGY